MKMSRHALASLPLAAGVWLVSGSAGDAVLAAVSSVLIDLDHVGDYLLYRGRWGGVRDFFECCLEGRLTKLYLLLHAWEWIALFLLLHLAGLLPSFAGFVALGMGYHLVFDQIGNRGVLKPFFYFLCLRMKQGFEGALLYVHPTETQLAALAARGKASRS